MREPSVLPVAAAGLAFAGLAALAVRAFFVEPARIEVTRHDLPLPDLPAPWEGRRVVHLSDLHYGNPRSDYLLSRMVEITNGLEPDLIFITGDFLVRASREVAPCVGYVRQLRARHGILAVLGDHDFGRAAQHPITGLSAALQEAGVRLLRNDAVELPGGLRIAGVGPSTGRVRKADLRGALKKLALPPHLLLAHSPDILSQASIHEIPMVLCGHTHGGQVVIPFYGPPITHTRVPRQFASGWSRMKDTAAYTGRGLSSHFSLRFLCLPEITCFTLTQGQDARCTRT